MRNFQLTQTEKWISFQKNCGKEVVVFEARSGAKAYCVRHKIAFGYSYLRCMGADLSEFDETDFQSFAKKCKVEKIISIVFEGYGVKSELPLKLNDFDKLPSFITSLSKGYHSKIIEKPYLPQSTVVLDLSLSKEKLLEQMKRKGRYNIKLGGENIDITCFSGDKVTPKTIDAIYPLISSTAKRDSFTPHEKGHYLEMAKSLGNTLRLYIGTLKNAQKTPVACIFICQSGFCTTYYYGASDYEHRALMAPYALQWKAITDAKETGSSIYDFMGISNIDPKTNAPVPNDHLSGVTDFKLKFGGKITVYEPPIEIIFSTIIHLIYTLAKKLYLARFFVSARHIRNKSNKFDLASTRTS